jgi:hypothetical protein
MPHGAEAGVAGDDARWAANTGLTQHSPVCPSDDIRSTRTIPPNIVSLEFSASLSFLGLICLQNMRFLCYSSAKRFVQHGFNLFYKFVECIGIGIFFLKMVYQPIRKYPYQSDTDTRVSVSMQHIPLQVREFQDGRILEHVHRWLLRYCLISFFWNLLFWEVRFSEKLLAGESAVWKIEVFVNFDYFECACFCVFGPKTG